MKCKHENADHLMPGDVFAPAYGTLGEFAVTVEQFRCIDCGAWLPLGPSTDTGPHAEAVAIEIRAAELAVLRGGAYCTNDAWAGWEAHERGWEPDPPIDCRAGYLARCIATTPKGATP